MDAYLLSHFLNRSDGDPEVAGVALDVFDPGGLLEDAGVVSDGSDRGEVVGGAGEEESSDLAGFGSAQDLPEHFGGDAFPARGGTDLVADVASEYFQIRSQFMPEGDAADDVIAGSGPVNRFGDESRLG